MTNKIISKIMAKKKAALIGLGCITLATISFILINNSYSKNKDIGLYTVKVGNIDQMVSITGQTTNSTNVDLAFEKGGKLKQVSVQVGSLVTAGQTLMQLENSDSWAQVSQAKAALEIQQIKLDQLKSGARPEEISLKQLTVDRANNDLQNTYNNLPVFLNSLYFQGDTAIKVNVKPMISNPDTNWASLVFVSGEAAAASQVNNEWPKRIEDLWFWDQELNKISGQSTVEEKTNALKNSIVYLQKVQTLLKNTSIALNGAAQIDQSLVNLYKTNVTNALNSINSALTSANNQVASIDNLKNTLTSAQQQLTLSQAGGSVQDILAQQAVVDQNQANLDYAYAIFNKTVLKAPTAGTVAKITYQNGEIVSPNLTAISLANSGKLEITANLSEADITKVNTGDKAQITLDTYGDNVSFEAILIEKDLAPTVIDGVNYYKIRLQFVKDYPNLIPGLTANIDITVAHKENVIIVPNRYVYNKDSKKFVKIVSDSKSFVEKEITTGLKSSNGDIEIITGLNIGDKIIAS